MTEGGCWIGTFGFIDTFGCVVTVGPFIGCILCCTESLGCTEYDEVMDPIVVAILVAVAAVVALAAVPVSVVMGCPEALVVKLVGGGAEKTKI